jgi:hypothetical protein
MNIARTMALLTTILLLAGCGSVEDSAPAALPDPPAEPVVPADLSVTLERTACRGTCPVYTVTVKADGQVQFDGAEHVANPGIHKDTIDAKAVAELVTQVEAADFFNLDDCYCEERFFDVPTSVVTVTMGGVSHSVTHLKGNEAPEVFLALEQKIDLVGGSDRWIKDPA